MRSAVKEFDERFSRPREVLYLLLSGQPRAGVFDGLDSREESAPTHPPEGAVGFLVAGNRDQGTGFRNHESRSGLLLLTPVP
jgi:hypothetical protein